MTYVYTSTDWIKYSKKDLVIKVAEFLTTMSHYEMWIELYEDISMHLIRDYNIVVPMNNIRYTVRSNLNN